MTDETSIWERRIDRKGFVAIGALAARYAGRMARRPSTR